MKIFLIGMMGSGKSTIGKKLSELINKNYIDIDEVIESKENMSINEIFHIHGEDYFRKIETNALHSITDSAIVACGGGIIVNQENRKYLNEHGYTIYLKTSIPVLVTRLKSQANRPLVKKENIEESIQDIYTKRKKLYEKTADFYIKTDDQSIDNIILKLLDQLKNEKNYSQS